MIVCLKMGSFHRFPNSVVVSCSYFLEVLTVLLEGHGDPQIFAARQVMLL